MAALAQGSRAPDFALTDADGEQFHLSSALRSGPVLVTFYKTDCPTCQYGLPFLDRLAGGLGGSGATAVAVSQDTPFESERFAASYEFSTRQVFDTEDSGFAVSDAYGLTNVPSTFLIAQDGRIAHTMVSWSKADVEEIAWKLDVSPPFKPGEDVLPFRPG